MATYKMTCANGWTETIEAKNLRGAKIQATKMATHDGGSYSIETPEGEIHGRRMWSGFYAWGFYAWERLDY